MDQQLRRAYRDQALIDDDSMATRRLSWSRLAIEHEPGEDLVPGPLGYLIDRALDCLETLLDAGSSQGYAQLEAWAASDLAMLQRLAIHGWIYRHDVDSTAKLTWLRQQNWLLEADLRHEVFRLIAETLAQADQATADGLVEDVVALSGDSEFSLYRAFNILQWMTHHAPNLASAHDVIENFTTEHGELQQSLITPTDTPESPPSMTADELHQKVQQDASAAVGLLLDAFAGETQFEAEISDMSRLLRQVVQQWPQDGLTVLDAQGADNPVLLRGVIRGWANSHPEDDQAQRILARIGELNLEPVVIAVARMLAGYKDVQDATSWRQVAGSRQLAEECWNAIDPATSVGLTGGGATIEALNHPAGNLAEYWLQELNDEWSQGQNGWRGLPRPISDQLKSMLTSDDIRGEMAAVVLARDLAFIYEVDSTWCESHLLPLLRFNGGQDAGFRRC